MSRLKRYQGSCPKWPYRSDLFKDVKRHGCTWHLACLFVDPRFLILLEVSPAQHDGFPRSRRSIYQLPFVLLRFREVGRGVISGSRFAVPKLGAMAPTC